MHLGLSLSHQIRQELTHSISLKQYISETRTEMVQELRGEKFHPVAECVQCGHKLTSPEIIKGFNDDPYDIKTTCPECGHRFMANLVSSGLRSRMELIFFCATQTLEQLQKHKDLPPDQIAIHHPSILQSALIHFGSLRQAFEKINRTYVFDEVGAWREKIQPFLGRLPDTVIANCVDVPVSAIRYMRRKLEIPPFRYADIEN